MVQGGLAGGIHERPKTRTCTREANKAKHHDRTLRMISVDSSGLGIQNPDPKL